MSKGKGRTDCDKMFLYPTPQGGEVQLSASQRRAGAGDPRSRCADAADRCADLERDQMDLQGVPMRAAGSSRGDAIRPASGCSLTTSSDVLLSVANFAKARVLLRRL